MGKRVKSSDVLDVNAVTKMELRAELIGRFEPTGPNKWDDWELLADEGEQVAIEPDSHIQLEPLGADPEIRFRFRRRRQVLQLRWLPTDEDRQQLASGQWGVQEAAEATLLERIFGLGPKDDPRDDMLEYFLALKAGPHDPTPGLGMTVMLIKQLRGK